MRSTDVLALLAVCSTHHVLTLWEVSSAHLVQFAATVGTEYHAREDGHLSHGRPPASDVSDVLHDVEGLLVDDGFVGVLEDLPLGWVA